MFERLFKRGTGHNPQLWPVFLLLVLAVVVPTGCVLWFMSQAMANERLAVRQKLTAVYRGQLTAIRRQLSAQWETSAAAVLQTAPERAGGEVFAEVVRRGLADSVILYDSSGGPIYPAPAEPPAVACCPDDADWHEAQRLEYRQNDPAAAASWYRKVAERSADPTTAGPALQAQARCLVKAGEAAAATDVLVDELGDEKYAGAADAQGRLLQPSACLMALQLMGDPDQPAYRGTAQRLVRQLSDYSAGPMPSNQRRFLMTQLQEIMPQPPSFDTLAAEQLASEYLEANPPSEAAPYLFPFQLQESWRGGAAQEGTTRLRPTLLREVWELAWPQRRIVALYTQEHIQSQVRSLIDAQGLPADVTVTLVPPETDPGEPPIFASIPAGEQLPGWHLRMRLGEQALLDSAAQERITAYLWTGVLGVLAMVSLAVLVAGFLRRQMRLTRLKNDLVATVSHELKTPLSSMRMLVDTLLDGHYRDASKTYEYLELISKENVRLSHLIDNFLTFSRMERNKTSFELRRTDAGEVVSAALEAMGDKFAAAGFSLESDIAADLPGVYADRDALQAVVLNLLDNAYKYSDQDKRVVVRAFEHDGAVCLEVEDHGIGLSSRAAKRIFDRFYQVDRSLSRKASGCGLGLNIVKFIVKAHEGTITVTSRPGEGSRFTVRLPRAKPAASPPRA